MGALKRLGPFVSLDMAGASWIWLKCSITPSSSHILIIVALSEMVNNQLTEHFKQKLRSRAVRVITKSSYEVSSSPLPDALGWENVISNSGQKHKAMLVFKPLRNLAPVSPPNVLQI